MLSGNGVHTCAFEQVNLRACLCAQLVSRFVFLLPRQSYWPRSKFSQQVAAKQHGRRFGETWAWKEVNVVTEMCCEQDNKNQAGGIVSRGRGGRRGAETTSQSNPNAPEITHTEKFILSPSLCLPQCHATIPKVDQRALKVDVKVFFAFESSTFLCCLHAVGNIRIMTWMFMTCTKNNYKGPCGGLAV